VTSAHFMLFFNRRKPKGKNATNVPSIQFKNDDARMEGKYLSKLNHISFALFVSELPYHFVICF